MNYSEAVSKAISGELIRKKEGNKDEFLFYKKENKVSTDKIKELPIDIKPASFLSELKRDISFSGFFCMWKEGKVHCGWRPTEKDLEAEWEVVSVEVTFPTICKINVASKES